MIGNKSNTREPGATDQRLSLDPNAPEIDGWEDGKDYTITLKVNQISAGEFTVNGIENAEPAEAAPDAENAGEAAAEAPAKKGGTGNPAVDNLM